MDWKFVNEQHKQQYHDALKLLASEDERQAGEAAKLGKEWERLPEDERMKRVYWLRDHFHKCRQPYIKLLTDILALATPVMIFPASEAPHMIDAGQ